jgi:hypothetical protein
MQLHLRRLPGRPEAGAGNHHGPQHQRYSALPAFRAESSHWRRLIVVRWARSVGAAGWRGRSSAGLWDHTARCTGFHVSVSQRAGSRAKLVKRPQAAEVVLGQQRFSVRAYQKIHVRAGRLLSRGVLQPCKRCQDAGVDWASRSISPGWLAASLQAIAPPQSRDQRR